MFEELFVVGDITQSGEDGQARFVIELVTERGVIALIHSKGEKPWLKGFEASGQGSPAGLHAEGADLHCTDVDAADAVVATQLEDRLEPVVIPVVVSEPRYAWTSTR